MDRVFLDYYEEELTHLRVLATEFSDMHPAIARNLSLDTVPCPDPYVERLLEGVAYLAARTRLKIDAERARFARAVIDALYPHLVAPAPAVGMVVLQPSQQVQSMPDGHVVPRGSTLVSALRPGLATRCTYATAQDVTLWPIEIRAVGYLQDRSAMAAAGIAGGEAEAAFTVQVARTGKGDLAELGLDRLDVHFRDRARAPALFDALFGRTVAVRSRPAGKENGLVDVGGPEMVGIADTEALLPGARDGFEGYRLLREYFVMPERFHFVRLSGLRPVVRRSREALEIVFLLRRPSAELASVGAADLALFATPIVNLVPRACNVIEIDPRRTRQPLYADRTRPRDFEIHRVLAVEDADADGGPEASIPPLFAMDQNQGPGWAWFAERRPRRPTDDERLQGQTRTSYPGDDVFLSLSRPPAGSPGRPLRRVAVTALCSNRDLPILDDAPTLALESGDPVDAVHLVGTLRPPRPAVAPAAPLGVATESRADDLAWRLVAQLSLNFLNLSEEGRGADPLHALLELYADRGDPALNRHVRAITRVRSRPVTERLPVEGPPCFGRGTEVTLDVDQSILSGHSALLLTALIARLFARNATVNGFVLTRTRIVQTQEDVPWPMTPGSRGLI